MVVQAQGWLQCPRGELARLSARLRLRRLLKIVVTVVAIVTATVVTATAVHVAANSSGGWFSSSPSDAGCAPCGTVTTDDCHGGATK
jgi:uncharacterized membrane protein